MATGKDAWIPEIWSKKMLQILHNTSVMRGLVNTDYQGAIKNGGDTVYARIPSAVTVGTYTRESDITVEALTVTKTSFVIDQQKYWAFDLDDLDKAQLDLPFAPIHTNEATIKMRDTIDTRLLSHYANTDAANVLGSTTTPIGLTKDNVYTYFTNVGLLLDNQKALSKRRAVVPPAVKELILNSPQLTTRGTNLVDETVTNGKLMKNFGGMEIHVTTNMAQVSGTYPLMFFTERYISFAMQFTKIEKVRREKRFADLVKGLALYGSTVFTQYDGDGAVLYMAA